jgi:hypothetical protein
LVLTDGHDFNAFVASKQSEVCQLLNDKNIVLDIILTGNAIGEAQASKFESTALNFLFPLCYSSRGRMFHPLNEGELKGITKLLNSEAFANLRVRMLLLAPRILNVAEITHLHELQRELLVFVRDVPVDIPFRQSDTRVEIDDEFTVNDGVASPYGRERIAAEILERKQSGYPIWVIKNKVGHFRVLILAPLEVHDDSFTVYWDLAMSFPPDYPYCNPVFRFLSVPPLKSVSPLGLITVTQHSCVSMTLASIHSLFARPDEWIPQEQIGPKPLWKKAEWWQKVTTDDYSVPLPLVSPESIELL